MSLPKLSRSTDTSSPQCILVLTCRDVLFSENGELKKALMVSNTTLMMYFSRMGSESRFSRLLQTCRGKRKVHVHFSDEFWFESVVGCLRVQLVSV